MAFFKEEIEKLRKDVPGCRNVIHLNNAGAGLMPRSVFDTISSYLQQELLFGGYEAADDAQERISEVYELIGRLLGTNESNIAIVENATVAVSQALSAFDFEKGDKIITTNVDYSSNQIMLLNLQQRFGIRVIRADDLLEGGVDPGSVEKLVREHHPRLVLMTWIPTNAGLIQDAWEVGKICARYDIPFIVDACQAVGQIPIDVNELPCDFLAATTRKFLRGPRGLGFLYVSRLLLDRGLCPLFPDTRGSKWNSADNFQLEPDAIRFENWEFPYALVLGTGEAVRYALDIGLDKIEKRTKALATELRNRLSDMNGVKVLDRGQEKGAIVSIAHDSLDGPDAVTELRKHRVNTSAVRYHHAVIDMDRNQVSSALRISPHYYNTEKEIEKIAVLIEDLISGQLS